jgi:hypothetical protein
MIQPQWHDLSGQDCEVTEEEIRAAVQQTPSEKSSGPDGFIGAFYKHC